MELSIQTADWSCPALESSGSSCYIRLNQENIESMVYRRRITGLEASRVSGDYCVRELAELTDFDYELLGDPMVECLLEEISMRKNEPIVLEVEAPFSLLAALMNPMDLYLCFQTEGEALTEILHKMADAQIRFVRKAIMAGVRVISLADPVGTMNMVGEDYYRDYCGESAVYLMRGLKPSLNGAIVHICKKMSQSLVIAGFASLNAYQTSKAGTDFYGILSEMAENENIYYTGMTCIHHTMKTDSSSTLVSLYSISLE